jgi:hypothetical protein
MPEYDDTDRRDDDRYDDDRGRPGGGAERVQTPGTVLLVFGLFSLLLSLGSLVLYVTAADTVAKPYHDFLKDMMKNQPKQPGQPDPIPPYEEFKQQFVVQGMIGGAIGSVCSLIIIVGGLKMRSLSGYGLAMTGAILALIPCTNSCCIIGMPVGIWALIVLVNADVKAAFRARARRASGGTD